MLFRSRAWLPLALLAGSSLFLGTIASDVSLSIAVETDDFPDVILCPFRVCNCLSPSVASWHEVFGFCQSGTRPSRGRIHWFVFWGSERSSFGRLGSLGCFEFFESLFEPLLSSFEVYELLLLLDGCGPPIFVHHEWGLDIV